MKIKKIVKEKRKRRKIKKIVKEKGKRRKIKKIVKEKGGCDVWVLIQKDKIEIE